MPDKTRSGASAFRPTYASRPNKTAAGMMKTSILQGERKRFVSRDNPWYPFADEHDAIVNRLLVHGTTDTLGRGRIYVVTTRGGNPCPCCGTPVKKYRLTDQGKKRLLRLRKEKAERELKNGLLQN